MANLFVFACLALVQLASCGIVTSVDRIKNMVLQEDFILDNLRAGLKREPEFQTFYSNRSAEIRTRNMSEIMDTLKHPNALYNLILKYADDYNTMRTLVDTKQKPSPRQEFVKLQLARMADNDDVVQARLSLVRLQSVYKLHPLDMMEGNYLGNKGPVIAPADAFLIGWTAFNDGRYKQSTSWFRACLNFAKPKSSFEPTKEGYTNPADISQQNEQDDVLMLEDGPDEITVKALMARSMVRSGHLSKAKTLFTELMNRKGGMHNAEVQTLEQEMFDKRLHRLPEKPYSDDDKKFSELCTSDSKINTNSKDPKLVCRWRSIWVPYFRVAEEVLHWSPYISLYYDVITDRETQHITQIAKNQLYTGVTVGKEGHQLDDRRSSHVTFIDDWDAPVVNWVSRRVERLTNLDLAVNYVRERFYQSNAEPMQVVNYGLGGHYSFHLDPIMFDTPDTEHVVVGSGDRLATFLLYLSDVEQGGATIFPKLNLAVAPVKNSALFWYSFKPSGELDELTAHAACPVLIGEKWVSNKWILNYGNTFKRRCGLTRKDTQLDIDEWMRRDWKPTDKMVKQMEKARKRIPMTRKQRREHFFNRLNARLMGTTDNIKFT